MAVVREGSGIGHLGCEMQDGRMVRVEKGIMVVGRDEMTVNSLLQNTRITHEARYV